VYNGTVSQHHSAQILARIGVLFKAAANVRIQQPGSMRSANSAMYGAATNASCQLIRNRSVNSQLVVDLVFH